jgi:sarcosine oxidase subunit gamma
VTAIPELCAGRPTLRIWCDGTYGHYLWETLLDIAGDLGGGAVVARSID